MRQPQCLRGTSSWTSTLPKWKEQLRIGWYSERTWPIHFWRPKIWASYTQVFQRYVFLEVKKQTFHGWGWDVQMNEHLRTLGCLMNLKAKEASTNLHGYMPAYFPEPSPTPCDWGPALPTSCSQRTRDCLGKDNVITTLPLCGGGSGWLERAGVLCLTRLNNLH